MVCEYEMLSLQQEAASQLCAILGACVIAKAKGRACLYIRKVKTVTTLLTKYV